MRKICLHAEVLYSHLVLLSWFYRVFKFIFHYCIYGYWWI